MIRFKLNLKETSGLLQQSVSNDEHNKNLANEFHQGSRCISYSSNKYLHNAIP